VNPSIDVVVVGRNEGVRLVRCLESVAQANRDSAFEVIYVDSASSDNSVALAADAGARTITLPPGPTTAARGRNAGWRAGHGEFVLFLDGDTLLAPEFLPRAIEEFADPQVAVVWGHRRELKPEASLYNCVLDLDWIYRVGVTEFCGGDALMRRSVLAAVNGYDERLIAGEEPEMCRRMRLLGYQILHIDCPMTGHDLAIYSWRQYWRRALRAGFAYASMAQRFAGSDAPLWTGESRKNLIQAPLMVAVPVTALFLSWGLRSWLPVALLLALVCLVISRTMLKVAWKSRNNWLTCFFYSVHSHLQQLPIFVGQLKFFKQGGRGQGLIEYKQGTS
jgi:cellulose synthase/poly-beta-1,6-N-acetylglucosamine synthase-like glycosyltransferase